MSVREIIQNNPWKALIGSISLSTIILTGVGAVFSEVRYAKADTVRVDKEITMQLIRNLEKQVDELAKNGK
jgi:hypothetical protein